MVRAFICSIVAAVLSLGVFAGPVAGETHYVDPVNGSRSGDGSEANPWRTLQEVFADDLVEWTQGRTVTNAGAPIKEGDTVLLLSGYHGDINIENAYSNGGIVFEAAPGHTPVVRRIRIAGGLRLTFRGLTITLSAAPTYSKATMVDLYSRFGPHCQEIVIEDCFIYSVLDTTGWSASDWVNKAGNGINLGLDGYKLFAYNNRLLNVYHGIEGAAWKSTIEHNEIVNFAGDGIRACNDDVVVQYNLIKNCYNVDDNHDDGIQGFMAHASGTPISDVTLRGNVIIMRDDPDQAHPGPLQGIGCFDGPYRGWIVENNVIQTDHWHGITFMGAEGCTIFNNTVFNKAYYESASGMQTWIQITASKSGDPSVNNVVRNNLSHRFSLSTSPSINAADNGNVVIARADDMSEWFVDYENFDLHLLATAPVIDAGLADGAPERDADYYVRPIGDGVDVGAYEFGSGPDVVADAGENQTVFTSDGDDIGFPFLDGSGSVVNFGEPYSFNWYMDGEQIARGETTYALLPIGTHTITLVVTSTKGSTDSDDVIVTVVRGSSRIDGDINGDGAVNLTDFTILKANFGLEPAQWEDGDLDGDGAVGLGDFVILKDNFGD